LTGILKVEKMEHDKIFVLCNSCFYQFPLL
jgi:hypothetical protein